MCICHKIYFLHFAYSPKFSMLRLPLQKQLYQLVIIRIISLSVSRIPSAPRRPIFFIVFSTPLDTIPSPPIKLLAVKIHIITQKCCIKRDCNLSCTGRLCSITDNTGCNRNGIHQCMCDRVLTSALQISNSAACRISLH